MKFVPHAYQRYCIGRIVTDPALGLWLDMGLGKTVITLTAVNDLIYNRLAVSRVLVVAPKKVAEATWRREADKWDHLNLLRVATVLGSTARRVKALNTPADVYVINRENVVWLVEHYRNAWPFDMVVLDEATSFKSRQSKRWKALAWVRDKITRMVELTGTPSPNGLMDLWTQVYLLDKGQRLGRTISQYREMYFDPGKRSRDQIFSYAPKEGSEEKIRRLIGDICVSMKAGDYLDLPEYVSDVIPVALDAKARKAYDKLEKDLLLRVDGSTIDAATAAALSNKLLQLCNGAVYDDAGRTAEIHRCKLEAFMELIEALDGQPALVFYNFRHDLDRLRGVLASTKLRVRELRGPQDEDSWNAGEVDVLLAHPASCAYGLNLQAGGHHAVWFGLNWSLELYQQANRRLYRQGQAQRVITHHLVAEGGRDEDVMAALECKDTSQEALLQSLKARIEMVRNG